MIILLGFILFIPNANCISDTVYLVRMQETDIYQFELSEGDLIRWRFRTYDDPFKVSFQCLEHPVYLSWDETSNSGVLNVLQTGTLRFRFRNIDDTREGYLEFEINIIYHSTLVLIWSIIAIIVIIVIISVILIIRSKRKRYRI
ncbi:MAG: hypothetical protein ACFE8M_12170 [Candidatus Hermodarchaeota archaeon]